MTDSRTALVVIAHADDLVFFCGGLVAKWAAEGWRVVVVRVTNDDKDSVGLSKRETIERNRDELQAASRVLGVAEVIDLDHVTDTLADVSEVELREQLIRLIRKYKPYATLTFDQHAVLYEDNQDHQVVAQATAEAFWTSMFDKHHPEHFEQGLAPHGVFEAWYFGRRLLEVNAPVDITDYLDQKIRAAICHRTMVQHIIHQLRLQAQTGGVKVPALDAAKQDGGVGLLTQMLRSGAASAGKRHDMKYAEEYRVHRFGGFEGLLED